MSPGAALDGHAVARAALVPVRLPDCFYLPRYTRFGLDVRDRMPWPRAITYVTDGVRFGVHFRDGSVEWLIAPRTGAAHRAADYALAAGKLPSQVQLPGDPGEVVRRIWAQNATVLARPDLWSTVAPGRAGDVG